MTVIQRTAGVVALSGHCDSEDAGILLQHLLANPTVAIDWSECDWAHTAVIQLLLIARPALQGHPRGAAVGKWIAPLLAPKPA